MNVLFDILPDFIYNNKSKRVKSFNGNNDKQCKSCKYYKTDCLRVAPKSPACNKYIKRKKK